MLAIYLSRINCALCCELPCCDFIHLCLYQQTTQRYTRYSWQQFQLAFGRPSPTAAHRSIGLDRCSRCGASIDHWPLANDDRWKLELIHTLTHRRRHVGRCCGRGFKWPVDDSQQQLQRKRRTINRDQDESKCRPLSKHLLTSLLLLLLAWVLSSSCHLKRLTDRARERQSERDREKEKRHKWRFVASPVHCEWLFIGNNQPIGNRRVQCRHWCDQSKCD